MKLIVFLCCMFAAIGIKAEQVSITFSEQGYSNGQSVTECKVDNNITITFDKGSNPSDAPKYYNTGTAVRLYAGNSITFTAAENCTLNKVEITTQSDYPVNKYCKVSFGELAYTTTKTTAKATISNLNNSKTVTFTNNNASSHFRILSITINYTINKNVVPSPTLPESSNFFDSKQIEIANNAEDATIYYTTDGTEPSVNSTKYTDAFIITETTTIKAVAIQGETMSDVSEATYTKVVPECVLPEVTPLGGSTSEYALDILQYSSIKIIPAEHNTVFYSINGEAPISIATETIIMVENVGEMTLSVKSVSGDKQLEAIYYYNVVESTPKVVAVLTPDEIANKKYDTGSMYFDGNVVESTCGEWSGYFLSDQSKSRLQLKVGEGIHIQSPEFPGRVISVTLSFTKSDNTVGRGFVIMPTSYSKDNATESTANNLGSASYQGQENPTSTVVLTGDATSFKIYATGGTICFSQIEVVYEKPENHVLKVGSSGWATLYLGLDATIPSDLVCYTIPSVANGVATLTPITGTLPAHTGVIVKATAKTDYTFKYNSSYAGSEGVDNLLKGSIVNTDVIGEGYVLAIPNGVIGLYITELTNGQFRNNAHKAYLPKSAIPAGQQSNGFRFDNGTTDIDMLESIQPSAPIIYDLTGRRVEYMEKGVYIINGRKVIKK